MSLNARPIGTCECLEDGQRKCSHCLAKKTWRNQKQKIRKKVSKGAKGAKRAKDNGELVKISMSEYTTEPENKHKGVDNLEKKWKNKVMAHRGRAASRKKITFTEADFYQLARGGHYRIQCPTGSYIVHPPGGIPVLRYFT